MTLHRVEYLRNVIICNLVDVRRDIVRLVAKNPYGKANIFIPLHHVGLKHRPFLSAFVRQYAYLILKCLACTSGAKDGACNAIHL